jgi:SAM-dependent methyltransferase
MHALPPVGAPAARSGALRTPSEFSYFSGAASLYDRSRPAYPDALIKRVLNAMLGNEILDVGCGTGIEARQFQAAGCTVLGVDPDARMAEFARGTGIAVEVATFEEWEAAGRAFDAVVAGTAWHWVDPLAGALKAAAVLKPDGLLAPFHHASAAPAELAGAMSENRPAWVSRSAPAYRQVAPGPLVRPGGQRKSLIELYQPLFDKMADGIRQSGKYGEPEQWRFDWERTYSRDEWLNLLPTFGAASQLPAGKLAEKLDTVGSAIDEMGGSFSMLYSTVAVAARRRDLR